MPLQSRLLIMIIVTILSHGIVDAPWPTTGHAFVATNGGVLINGGTLRAGLKGTSSLSKAAVGVAATPTGKSFTQMIGAGDELAFATSPSAPISPQGTYSDWSLPGNDYYNIDTPIVPVNDPRPSRGQVNQAYFYASQFGFTGGPGGYAGIQTDANGKRAIFSIWDADQALCSGVAGAICQPFGGEGVGYQTMIPYPWTARHAYRTRVWALNKDASGEWWLGAILDDTLGTEAIIGSIHVPTGRGRLSGTIYTWVEWYAPQASNCTQLPLSLVFFGRPRANAGSAEAGSPTNHYGAGACPSLISGNGARVRHRNGWGNDDVLHCMTHKCSNYHNATRLASHGNRKPGKQRWYSNPISVGKGKISGTPRGYPAPKPCSALLCLSLFRILMRSGHISQSLIHASCASARFLGPL